MINLTDAMYLYITTEFDANAATYDPPSFALVSEDTPEDTKQFLRDAAERAAHRQDKYLEIKHVALLHGDKHVHLLNHPEEILPLELKHRDPPAHLVGFGNEGALVDYLWHVLVPESGILPMSLIVGWNIRHTWALLVNKALKYGIPVPTQLRQDPLVRYTTVDCLMDVSAIYLQGITPAVRTLPDLRDVLDYWEALDKDITAYPSDREMQIYVKNACDWTTGNAPARVEFYLDGMQSILERYYGEREQSTDMRRMLRVITGGTRGPQPPNDIPPAVG